VRNLPGFEASEKGGNVEGCRKLFGMFLSVTGMLVAIAALGMNSTRDYPVATILAVVGFVLGLVGTVLEDDPGATSPKFGPLAIGFNALMGIGAIWCWIMR
jgi:uncharacterized membrane protein SpoIIM required for sporulation